LNPSSQRPQKKGIFAWQSVGPFKPHFNRNKYALFWVFGTKGSIVRRAVLNVL
jgi:hypothetical protein